jgi:plastocyanin
VSPHHISRPRLVIVAATAAAALLAGCSGSSSDPQDPDGAVDDQPEPGADDEGTDAGPEPDRSGRATAGSDTAEDAEPDSPPRATLADPDSEPLVSSEGPTFSDVLTIQDRRYEPFDLLIGAERELRIVNLDDEAHTVTAFDGSFDVRVGPGEEAEILTPWPGAYPYSCRFHPEMGGEMDVM